MKIELENYLYERIPKAGDAESKDTRTVISEMKQIGMIEDEKQAHATLEKWLRQGKYNYGVCLDLGWKE